MTPERWRRVEAILAAAIELDGDARSAYLANECGDDAELRAEVESLLAFDDEGGGETLARVVRGAASEFEADCLSVPQGVRLGAYRIIREIGRGGMGTVYLAERDDDQFRKRVAIKLVTHGMDTKALLGRFRREREILARLEHPYIARLLDGGSNADGRPYLVMEYVEGTAINAYCVERGLAVRDRILLFLKVLAAVECAHRNLVVHRDLKPGNILIDTEGSPKLLDFGIAKLLGPDEAPEITVEIGAVTMLTPDYASPEQVRRGQITTATDVYSLGAILYELLCGEKAHQFGAHGLRDIELVISEVDPPRMSETSPALRRVLGGDLDAIVAMAMRKEPDRRYHSVEQLGADLQNYLDGRPVTARHGTFRYRAGKYLVRHRTAVAAGVLVALGLLGGAAVATRQAVRADREKQHALESQAVAEASRRDAETQAAEAHRQRQFAQTEQREAESQRATAEKQRRLADRRFDQVHQLAGKFLVEFHDAIAKLPGSTPARKMAVQTGLEYYDMLVHDAGGNRDLLEEIARGYDRLGDVQGNPYFGNLGDSGGALSSYRKALSIREKIADPSPQFTADRIRGGTKIAQVLAAQGDLAGAQKSVRQVLAVGERSPAASSNDVREALGKAYSTLGDLKIKMGVHGEAVEPYVKLLEFATLIGSDTDISLAHTKLGDVLCRLDRQKEALDHLRVALAIDGKLSAKDPTSMTFTRKVFMDYNMLARVVRSRSGPQLVTPAEAKEYFEGAAGLGDKMVAADPDNRLALTDMGIATSSFGEWLLEKNEIPAAVAAQRKAVAAIERMASLSTQTTGNEDFLIHMYSRLATALTAAGQFDEALAGLRKAADALASAEKQNPGLSRNLTRKGEILHGEARVHMAQKHWELAIPPLTRMISILESQRERDPKNETFLSSQPEIYNELAECYSALGRRDEATRANQAATLIRGRQEH
jgi:tetratricopeptide (TPR) repeat protein/tRNA A-37 threonylcarbamoyl transferase component Bud32